MGRRAGMAMVFGLLAVLATAGAAGAVAPEDVAPIRTTAWETTGAGVSSGAREATVDVRQADGTALVEVEARTEGIAPVVQEVTVDVRSGESESEGAAVGGSGGALDPVQVQRSPGALPVGERVRILRSRPASGGPGVSRERELRIAREGIVARPVGRISKDEYERLYKVSAARFGFREDWYVLAAVGWVESQHGENMGPSSAGAMGPMQFLPSTWKVSGMDGNRDGVANVMDPEDAIPAAARYLKRGGAPGDWRAALYTYNHAGWYVEKVLDSAERYRTLAKDDEAGPYR